MKVILKASNLRWRSREQVRLSPVSFTVKQGEIFGLMGNTSCKNIEVLKILTGHSPSTSGSLTVLGTSNIDEVRYQIGSTFDVLGFRAEYSIEKNLRLICMIKGINQKEAKKMMLLFDLWNHKNKKLAECSRIQKKCISIICAIMGNPSLILIDKPLETLTKGLGIVVCKLLLKAAANGQTIFITDSPSSQITKICTQTLELEKPLTKSQIRKIKKTYMINKKAS